MTWDKVLNYEPCTWLWGNHSSHRWSCCDQQHWQWEHRYPSDQKWQEWKRISEEAPPSTMSRTPMLELNHLWKLLMIHVIWKMCPSMPSSLPIQFYCQYNSQFLFSFLSLAYNEHCYDQIWIRYSFIYNFNIIRGKREIWLSRDKDRRMNESDKWTIMHYMAYALSFWNLGTGFIDSFFFSIGYSHCPSLIFKIIGKFMGSDSIVLLLSWVTFIIL